MASYEAPKQEINLHDIELTDFEVRSRSFKSSPSPFLSIYPSNKSALINFNKKAVELLEIIDGDNIGFKFHADDPNILFIYKSARATEKTKKVYKYLKNPFRIHSKDMIDHFVKRFRIKDMNTTYRIYINTFALPRVIDDQRAVMYMLYDIPELRSDMTSDEKEEYHNELTSSYSRITYEK